ncbi:acyltransferase [Roseobacter sp.]|uniref:acyltransferase family protein n=1 Tax=Roseobacter sp. TaxID=1907202 RepID=UPI0025D07E5C|nr:acyltransferase [Roseobacter sp.]
MVAYAGAVPEAVSTRVPVETMRSMAVLLLVSYHVIGAGDGSGLNIAYPHMLRLYADFFIDLRMPLFAFIAGYVYALRPVTAGHYADFLGNKLRRLLIPGILAITAFAIVANVVGTRFAQPLSDLWYLLVTPYAHFWFLQSALVIFVVFGLIDIVLSHRFTIVLLMASGALCLSGFRFETSVMSVNGALYLLPFFLTGVVVLRHGTEIAEEAEKLTLVLLVLALVCAFWNIRVLYETGVFSMDRHDVQSLGFGVSVCLLAAMWCPRLPLLERLSPYAFTIYLYHIFGTVPARVFCDALGIGQTHLQFLLGLAGGLLIPVLICEAVQRKPGLSELVTGRQRRLRSGLGAP